jgi:hypothetical protein
VNLGGHTVTFVAITEGSPGRVGPTPARAETDVTGCFMQPLGTSEVITDTDVATQSWRCIAPPVAAALSANSSGELIFNGDTYEIIGARPYSDFSGVVDHVTVDCRIQRG